MSEKVKGMFGNPKRAEEVKEWLRTQGAKDVDEYNTDDTECVYYVHDEQTEYVSSYLVHLFDIVELPKHKFKPFDKVLVRRGDTEIWLPRFFGYHRPDSCDEFTTTTGAGWSQCIPYEGNENLVGTNKNPEEE